MNASFEVVVAGAGPGGMAAASIAAETGMRVCLIDANRIPGGQIWRGLRTNTAQKYPHGSEFVRWNNRLRRTDCEVWSGWQVIDSPAPDTLRLECDGQIRDVEFRRLILATGGRERFLPFPGWTLPGVTGAGGLQALAKEGLDVRGRRIVVAGTGPLLLAISAGLADAGAKILCLYEQASFSRLAKFGLTLAGYPGKLREGVRYLSKLSGVPYRTGYWVVCAEGADRIERVTVTNGEKTETHDCDWLACGFHLVPNLELPRLLGCQIVDGYVSVDMFQHTSVSRIACIGELTGIGGLEKALVEGEVAGLAVAGRAAEARALAPRLRKMRSFAQKLDRAFALCEELRAVAVPQTFVCRCEDVPLSELEKCGSWREAKLHTRCGMGACQARICGAAAEFLFDWRCTGSRPPVFPAAVSSLAPKADPLEPIHH
jgi:NADPH-dependent 2,4-dienoyl-CoA reductase/sulfur reductase-like enzyme